MFINSGLTFKFKVLKAGSVIILFFIWTLPVFSQVKIRGYISEKDTSTNLSFAYIINKSTGNGTMSDHEGRFSLLSNLNDTLVCSYVGYLKTKIPVRDLKADEKGFVRIIMVPMAVNLNAVTVVGFKIKPYERDYMNDIIDRSKIRKIDYLGSPVSALYMQFSREGKQVQKLARIFEQLLIDEQVQEKLSREILVRLTGDENIDYNGFRKYCYYVNDYFIVHHEGVELYQKVMECYRHWTAEGRDAPPKLRQTNTDN